MVSECDRRLGVVKRDNFIWFIIVNLVGVNLLVTPSFIFSLIHPKTPHPLVSSKTDRPSGPVYFPLPTG